MPAVDLDRQAVERRDFPIGRRGYDPAAVDAHLRALAVEIEEMQRAAVSGGAGRSLATSAGNHVQNILEAAETAAADIERQAQESAKAVREAADRDAERTREQALEKARGHVAAVAQVAATLLERVGAMDGEVRVLVDSLRAGTGRLAGDLAAVETNMAELYDAASGRASVDDEQRSPAPAPAQPRFQAELAGEATAAAPEPAPVELAETPAGASSDLDGARLIALNMALNGDSRADTERYLAENFQLPDREKLVDEVYAAIEG
jgi:hypothetical protein